MKYFFRHKTPAARGVLLMESGSPEVSRRALEGIRQIFPQARFHLCTCWPDPVPGQFASVYRVTDYPSLWGKLRLLLSFRKNRWDVLAILCTGEPVMWPWKTVALFLLPAKVLIVNENADFFWLDWKNRKTLRRFLAIRWGVNQKEFLFTILRALVFPITLLFLLATTGFLYARRWRRLTIWKIRERLAPKPQPSPSPPLSPDPPQPKNR